MAIMNLTPDSFFEPSRVPAADAVAVMQKMIDEGADIIDLGAVSTRPGAPDVPMEEEWIRLQPALEAYKRLGRVRLSIDTFRAEIVRRAYEAIGPFIVNDISAGEDDSGMLPTVGALGLPYIAMHKRGNPRTMDTQVSYPQGIIRALQDYFTEFAEKAGRHGITQWWIDPGLGFAKTPEQCWEILERLPELVTLGHPVLIGAADKRFTGGNTEKAHELAVRGGADILRVHNITAARQTIAALEV